MLLGVGRVGNSGGVKSEEVEEVKSEVNQNNVQTCAFLLKTSPFLEN